LIDAIGNENAASRKYVVKQGPAYQAFDEQGLELNGSEDFFASIMHALPDESRQALGIPHVSQSAELQKTVIDSAINHRTELEQRLEERAGASQSFKPPARVTERRVGYYASGRGQGVSPSLVTRVRDVYPGLTDQQASAFILRHLRAGKTDAQIYGVLQARIREWEALQSTLDQWVGALEPGSFFQYVMGGKATAARNIKQAWRNSPLAEESPHYRLLDIVCDDPLPSLSADFSHVGELSLRGRCVTDANADTLLGAFPNLKTLRISATGDQFTNVPEALNGMRELTYLSLYSSAPYAADMPSRLSALTTLEDLSLYSSDFAPMELDVSRLRNLRKLEVIAPSLYQWPAGVLELPLLERLDLKSTGIKTVPDEIFAGREKLWSGLSLDWSIFPRENFKPAYEYIKNHPEHLIDLEEMVRDYCRGELMRISQGISSPSMDLFNGFIELWQGAQTRFEAVDALSEQHDMLEWQLAKWTGQAVQMELSANEALMRSMATISIRTCWRNGAFKRYVTTADASMLWLPDMQLRAFPELPSGAFEHVQALHVTGTQATAGQLQGFVRGFTELRSLDLSGNGLSEVPIASGDLAKLTRLDLSNNRIVSGPAVEQGIAGLSSLEYLDLRNNPLNTLDVRGMSRLKALGLRGTGLLQWPTGAQDLTELDWLDLRDSKIFSLPEEVLQSDALLKAGLTGTPLTPQALTKLKMAWQRIEVARGLPAGALESFSLVETPPVFPPPESGSSLVRQLLPLSDVSIGEGAAHFAERLQRLKPALADGEALQAIDQLSKKGMTEVQIGECIRQWEQTFETLTRRLNGWLFTRESRGAGWLVSAESRKLGALRILDCWREGLSVEGAVEDHVLDLNGLQLGDLPELPAEFSHVGTLNLTGVRLSEQGSDAFLKAFTRLKTLQLNGNALTAIPQPVGLMNTLERLELSTNRFGDAEHLDASLNRLERLTWLDLSYNALDTFDMGVFEGLETLDLRNNNLIEWPEGVLEVYELRTLDLSGNDIVTIPLEALDGSHDELIAATYLNDNFNLSRESLERLRDYREAGARDTVLGLSRTDLDELIAQAEDEGSSDSNSESYESDEALSDQEPDSAQSASWLANTAPEKLAARTQIWNQLMAEPDNVAFFHLLSRLQDTREFKVANADLTRRVWTVMEAAASNTELREILFAASNTHGTCVDGRILTFSGLESKVFTHNALLDIPAGRLAEKGQALLKLSRQLFRLDKVDDLATKATAGSGRDEAEVRLGYRIGLTGGWSDGLELPGQPKHMTYASGVTPGQLADARAEITQAEHSEAFFEDLIQRDYWVDYLKEKYPSVFTALDDADMSMEIDDADDAAFMSRLFDRAAARNGKMIELSRQEVGESTHPASGEPQPGTSKSQSLRSNV
jgi:Leucine-rich repeat (LRR) protein